MLSRSRDANGLSHRGFGIYNAESVYSADREITTMTRILIRWMLGWASLQALHTYTSHTGRTNPYGETILHLHASIAAIDIIAINN